MRSRITQRSMTPQREPVSRRDAAAPCDIALHGGSPTRRDSPEQRVDADPNIGYSRVPELY